MKNLISKNNKGFSLIEVIIYVAIIGGLLVTLTNFILAISGSRNKSYAQQEVNANTRLALNILTHKIKSSNGINVSSSTFNTSPGVLSLSMSSSTLSPTIFTLSNGRLTISEGVTTSQFITSQRVNISSLIFTNLTADSNHGNVGISMSFNYASSSDASYNFSSSLNTAVNLRQ